MSTKSDPDKAIAIIPARYGSSRFPGKPLAKIHGTSMIVHVCRRTAMAIPEVVVATDDLRIADEVRANGFRAVMTSPDCPNGTARVLEAYRKLTGSSPALSGRTSSGFRTAGTTGIETAPETGTAPGIIVNVQGDEPMVSPGVISRLADSLRSNPEAQIATVASRFRPEEGFEALFDPNRVKMTVDDSGRVLYFSRSIIPYVRDHQWQQWVSSTQFLIHNGLYAFRADVLPRLVSLPPSSLEQAENLEQLRWLQNGYRITAIITDHLSPSVDTPADLDRIKST